jgi:hypothetical protein
MYPFMWEDRAWNYISSEVADQPEKPCQKYVNYMSKQTGGIMIIWCRHRICVGFHIFEKGEGRNDVFSPIYTRWPRAPRIVVYDFACQLMPYCMVFNL